MTRIYMVRHGEASYGAADYDRLSAVGESQCRLLAAFWIDAGQAFDRILVGPRRRHRQTHDLVEAAFRQAGRDWPDPRAEPGFDEYPGIEVMRRARPDLAAAVALSAAALPDYAIAYREVTRRWVRGELPMPDLESWQQFRSRVRRAVFALEGAGAVVAFTSAGSVAAASALALGLDDEKTLELSYQVRNSAFAQLSLCHGQVTLESFNCYTHLESGAIV